MSGGLLDPLQSVETQAVQDNLLDEDTNNIATSRSDQTSVVLHWSVEQVKNWLEHSVPIESYRLKGNFGRLLCW